MSTESNLIKQSHTSGIIKEPSGFSGRSFRLFVNSDVNGARSGSNKELGQVTLIQEIKCNGKPSADGSCLLGTQTFSNVTSSNPDYAKLLALESVKVNYTNALWQIANDAKNQNKNPLNKQQWNQLKGSNVPNYNAVAVNKATGTGLDLTVNSSYATTIDSIDTTNNGGTIATLDDIFSKIDTVGTPEDIAKEQSQIFGSRKLVYLQYPKDANYVGNGDLQDSLVINQYFYKAPLSDLFSKDSVSGSTSSTFNPNVLQKFISTGLQRNTNLREHVGTIRLPVPNNIQDASQVGWEGANASTLQMGLFMSTLGGVMGSQNPFSLLQNITAGTGDIINKLGDLPPELKLQLSALVSKTLLGKLGVNVDTDQAIARATGAIPNPNLELLFSGPSLRAFQFSFTLAPQDDDEAKDVRSIIRFFKQGMAPRKLKGGKSAQFLLGSPNVFSLQYKSGKDRITSMNAFKICALTSAAFNYTPTGQYSVYDDPNAKSQPVATQMTLNFQELTPIYNTDYEPGSTDVSVIDGLGPSNKLQYGDDVGF